MNLQAAYFVANLKRLSCAKGTRRVVSSVKYWRQALQSQPQRADNPTRWHIFLFVNSLDIYLHSQMNVRIINNSVLSVHVIFVEISPLRLQHRAWPEGKRAGRTVR